MLAIGMLNWMVRQSHENRDIVNSSDGRALLFARHSEVLVTGLPAATGASAWLDGGRMDE